MGERVGSGWWSAVSRFALVGMIGGSAAACSSDTMRFSEPFKNPFASSERLAETQPQPQTPASAPAQVAAMPAAPVQSQPLAPVQTAPTRVASAPVTSGQGGWSAAGGTRITVGASDSLNALSQRYGVPTSAILAANNLSSANQVTPGSQIVIPVYSATAQPSAVAAAPAPAQPKLRFVEGPKPTQKAAAKAEGGTKQRVRPGMTTTARTIAPAPVRQVAAAPTPAAPVEKPVPAPAAPAPAVVAKPAPVQAAAPAPQPAPVQTVPTPEPDQTGALGTKFRWPAHGRVIAGFGANGGNDGINISVPEGTPVKAAEAGTVTYAGNEVKGYGNLVLIRHDNGYVSAYAHNASLNVKRGDRVNRGQVIATSGQTGNVTSPQLHFELRKNQAPVDPIPLLASN